MPHDPTVFHRPKVYPRDFPAPVLDMAAMPAVRVVLVGYGPVWHVLLQNLVEKLGWIMWHVGG